MLDIELKTIRSGYDRKTCWVHPRAGLIPGDPQTVVLTLQKLRLTGTDVFSALHEMRSVDGGETWTDPIEHTDTLGRGSVDDTTEVGICDFWPGWHEKSGVLLGIGHTVRYANDDLFKTLNPRSTAYSTYNPNKHTWAPWKKLETAYPEKFNIEGAGSVQRYDLPNGDILLPTYFSLPDIFFIDTDGSQQAQDAVTVMHCSFDGETLRYLEHGNEMTMPFGRGLSEPSLAFFKGRYYLTIRNDDYGFITSGEDGLHFDEPKKWTWDDGSELGNYNTQQHWVTMPDALYLVYTRRGANNDHICRNRAPLFIAQVDTDKLCVIRDTEQILMPERGARLGNFGVVRISENESWVTDAEWMQATDPDPFDCTVCEKYGSDNSIYLAKVRST